MDCMLNVFGIVVLQAFINSLSLYRLSLSLLSLSLSISPPSVLSLSLCTLSLSFFLLLSFSLLSLYPLSPLSLCSSYADEQGPKDWPVSRFSHLMKLRQAALRAARRLWADYILVTTPLREKEAHKTHVLVMFEVLT